MVSCGVLVVFLFAVSCGGVLFGVVVLWFLVVVLLLWCSCGVVMASCVHCCGVSCCGGVLVALLCFIVGVAM